MELKNNPKINSYIRQAKVSRGLKNIGFVAIPCAVIATAAYGVAGFQSVVSGSTDHDAKVAGNTFAALGTFCLGTSIYFGVNENVKHKKAVHLYNELYTTEY